MPHLKINSYVGRNPLRSHRPQKCYRIRDNSNLISLGEEGDCVLWQNPQSPTFTMLSTMGNSATNGMNCIGLVNTFTLFEEQSIKIISVSSNNRVRLWRLSDGVCLNISEHGLFDEKITGCCSDLTLTRYFFLHSQSSIYVFDSWKMEIVSHVRLDIRVARMQKETVNDKTYLLIFDIFKKKWHWDVSEICRDKWQDYKNLLAGTNKFSEELEQMIAKIPSINIEEIFMQTKESDIIVEDPQALKNILDYLNKKEEMLEIAELIEPTILKNFPTLLPFLLENGFKQIRQSCLIFINHSIPYLFLAADGVLVGIPIFQDYRRNKIPILYEDFRKDIPKTSSFQMKFLNNKKNSLVISFGSGFYRIYSLEMVDLTIQSEVKAKKDDPTNDIVRVSLSKFLNYCGKWSSPVKYILESFRINIQSGDQSPLSAPSGPNDMHLSLQLQNKQIAIINLKDRTVCNLRGFSSRTNIYSVVSIDSFYGVATQQGLHIFRADNGLFQRTITYDNWQWKDYNLHKKVDIEWNYNNYKSFRQNNTNSGVIANYTNRYLSHALNYVENRFGIVYETFGQVNENSINNENYMDYYFRQRAACQTLIHSRNTTSYMSIIRSRRGKQRKEKWENTSHIIHCDVKRQIEKIFIDTEGEGQINVDEILTAFWFLWPQDADQQLTKSLQQFLGHYRPAVRGLMCFQGIGLNMTVYLQTKNNYQISPFITSYNALCLMLYLITICNRDNTITESMFKCVEYFTVRRPPLNKPLSIQHLACLSIELNNNVVNAGCNLMISGMLNNNSDLSRIQQMFLMNLKFLEENRSKLLTQVEIYWMLILGFSYIYGNKEGTLKEMLINRLIGAIDLGNFELVPDLMAINLKILNEGLEKWRSLIEPSRAYGIMNSLSVIFFFYDGLANLPKEERRLNISLDLSDAATNKRMKQIIIKTMVYLANQYTNEFIQLLKKETVNQDLHPFYPCSVIELLRQFLKSQKPTKHLVFYVELLLKCISPTTPQLRKYVQKNVTQTLYFLCTYRNISFNQPSQKISLLSANHIFIYDLRTATKWRTIDIEHHEGIQYIVQMSPKGNYIAAMGKNLKIWRLSSSFWSGVLGAFSQGWTFQASGKGINWQENEASITIVSENPNHNKTFAL